MAKSKQYGATGRLTCCAVTSTTNLPPCLVDGIDMPRDQRNTVIHEVLQMVFAIPVTEEAKVAAISGVIQPRTRKHK